MLLCVSELGLVSICVESMKNIVVDAGCVLHKEVS